MYNQKQKLQSNSINNIKSLLQSLDIWYILTLEEMIISMPNFADIAILSFLFVKQLVMFE